MALSLKLASKSDAAAIAAIYAPHVLGSATSLEQVAPDADEMGRRIAALQQTHPWLVAESGGTVVGYCYASPHRPRAGYRWCTEVSVYVSPDQHRGRIGRALYTALFEILVLQQYVTAYAGITLPNEASVAFHEAMGFETIGIYQNIGFKLGRWHDVVWYSRPLVAAPMDPEEPIPLRMLREVGALPGYVG
ncbi:MAG: GNAT family N-acetyltransferase [Gemmatimonadota bacterium]|nr:GNAT family N-acetyltransferase [Gemmatimonadota bacterium]